MDEPQTSLAGAAPSDLPEETLASFGGDELRARIFYDKYALRNEAGVVVERTPEEMWKRVAREIASVEPDEVRRAEWERKFGWLLEDFKFIPGGRILHGAGNPRRVTLLNCYVIPIREDSIEAIFDWMKEAARTYSFGGGVGTDISVLRPRGSPVHNAARTSTGSVSFMELFSLTTGTIGQSGRRGALMITIADNHPDLLDFIKVKRNLTSVRYANISVRVSDAFMQAVDEDRTWDLRFHNERASLERTVRAREVWDELIKGARDYAEPGVIFWDTVKRYSTSEYNGMNVITTNPCSLVGSTYVITPSGIHRLDALVQNGVRDRANPEVLIDRRAGDGHGVARVRVDALAFTGVKQIYRVETTSGFTLRGTGDHKVKVLNDSTFDPLHGSKGWKRIDELQPGDVLAVMDPNDPELLEKVFGDRSPYLHLDLEWIQPRRRDSHDWLIDIPERWDDDLAYFLGYVVGDGSYTHHSKRSKLANRLDVHMHAEDAPYIKPIVDRVVGRCLQYRRVPVGVGAEGELSMKPLPLQTREGTNRAWVSVFSTAFFRMLHSLGLRPAVAHEKTVPESILVAPKEATAAFLRGLFDADGTISGPREQPMVSVSSTSRRLIEQVQLLLLQFGIFSTITTYHAEDKNASRLSGLTYMTKAGEYREYRGVHDSFKLCIGGYPSIERFATYIGSALPRKQQALEALLAHRKMKLRSVTSVTRVARVVAEGISEPVYDLTVLDTKSFIANGLVVSNSEIPLEPYGNCCLGNVNLSAFVLDPFTPRARIDWEALEPALRYATRFLDNVLDYNAEKHPLPQQREASLRSRRIGVGFTGLGDMLIKLRLKYDTPEAIDFVDRLFEQIKNIVYDESVNLAVEKGTFPGFSPKEHLSSLFIQTLDPKVIGRIREHGLRNVALLTAPPVGSGAALAGVTSGIEPVFDLFYIRRSESLSQEVFKVYHPLVREYMQRFNIASEEDLPDFFVTAHQIKPELRVQMQATIQRHIDHSISSCLTRNNLILTDRGFRYIDTIHAERREGEFVPLKGWRVFNEHGLVEASDFYYNGARPVYKVTLEGGYEIEGTANHRVLVLTEDHGLCWRRLDELKEDDCIVLRKGLEAWGNLRELSEIYEKPFSAERRRNAHPIRFPHRITKPLARFLGYLLSDEGILDNGNTVVFTQEKGEVLDHFCQLSEQLFGIRPKLERDLRGRNVYNAKIHSGLLTRFLGYLGASYRGKEKRTPLCVLSAGREIVKEFIRGLTLDGYVSRLSDGNPCITVLCSLSGRLVREIQQLLLNFGIESNIVTKPYSTSDFTKVHGRVYHHENRILYDLYLTAENAHRFMDLIGFAENHKNEQAWQVLRKTRLMRAPLGGVVPVNGQVVGALREAMKQVRSYQLYEQLHSLTQHMQARKVVARDHLLYALEATRTIAVVPGFVLDSTYTFKRVKSVVQLPEAQETFDLSVPEGHHYVANGIVSHNTVNLPRETSPEEVERIYFLAWKLGCKGVTVYREGSRQGILITEEEARRAREQVVVPLKAEAEKPGEPSRATPRPRPKVTHGRTERIETPRGRIYVTINEDEMGICEVFVKSLDVEAEAIGRLASLAMRAGVDPREIIEQLWRVQSTEVAMDRSSEGTVVRITTIAQGVALALGRALYGDGFRPDKEFPLATALPVPGPRYRQEILRFRSPAGGEQRAAPRVEMGEGGGVSKNGEVLEFVGVCPDCGARLIYENGCTLCRLCGYSKC